MSETTSWGAYYVIAVELRRDAGMARRSYPTALENAQGTTPEGGAQLHAALLIVQAVGFELAAALYCVAQALEDSRR